jgi:hypothetical protein
MIFFFSKQNELIMRETYILISNLVNLSPVGHELEASKWYFLCVRETREKGAECTSKRERNHC